MKKDHFWVNNKTKKAGYNFWANAASKELVWMSVNFQFDGIDPFLKSEFEKYCIEKKLSVARTASASDITSYLYNDLCVNIIIAPRDSATRISFTRKYSRVSLTLEDFLYFKNSVAPFLEFVAKKPDASPLVISFQNQAYETLVGLLNSINPKERLVDEMAFLLRCKDDPKKLRFTVENIRRYAGMLNYNPEKFLKKELGEDYII